jgi:hypothetical protein
MRREARVVGVGMSRVSPFGPSIDTHVERSLEKPMKRCGANARTNSTSLACHCTFSPVAQ